MNFPRALWSVSAFFVVTCGLFVVAGLFGQISFSSAACNLLAALLNLRYCIAYRKDLITGKFA